ncbi:MAG TPA: hypothetical protein PLJ35_11055 [Anaerolineae bacterium]|nr:hypothetical protein [Anaerolineae bacterium]HOQ99346.1 hypothetical protein [Anaerolineae bacterium]HPL26783.1 hypothetical protein [Anaerolineae bacterium]
MFATLFGTNTGSFEQQAIFDRLREIAIGRGFLPPDTRLHVQEDQIPLKGWFIELRGPADHQADFLLAVTSPAGISPIPVMHTVSGPLFAVNVADTFFLVSWRRDVAEFKDSVQVLREFEEFLDSLGEP